ncbi:MAG: hypothetical protein KY391_02340 [Actinobacteria bacterium]|nr:hypothetical protein [Actinomycetota bacterium]
MEGFAAFLRWATLIAFALLGLISFRLWLRRRDKPAFWTSLAFSDLALALVLSRLPEEGSPLWEFLDTFVIAIIVLFPYFLYRVAASFAPGASIADWVAGGATGVVFLWAVFAPGFPADNEPEPFTYRLFLLSLLFQWALCSVLVAIRFWRGGSGQPAVTRKRMRLLSIAASILTVALIIALSVSGDDAAADIAAFSCALLSAGMFYLAFAPPTFLRALWRRESEENMRRAVIDLMGSVTDEAVVEGLLPHAATVVGAQGVAMLGPDGRVIGSYGADTIEWADVPNLDDAAFTRECLTKLDFAFGSLVVKTAPYTSFFGRDEVELLGALGVLTNFALERVRATEMRRELAEAQIRKQQALQINDNVVQGLAVAKYAFDLGDNDKAKEAIEGTLVAARKIMSDLLDEVSTEEVFGPAALTRDDAATGFVKKNR